MALSSSEIQYQEAHIKDNATASIIAANVITFTIALIATFLRLIARRLQRLTLQTDDFMLMTGTVSSGNTQRIITAC